MKSATLAMFALFVTSASIAAQWPEYPAAGIPRTADGRPNLSAPAPRAADGKPDLSGIWQAEPDPTGVRGGVEGIVAPRYMIDITKDLMPGAVPFLPESEALYRQRAANSFKDNPLIRCLPAGVPRLDAYVHPYKIIQTARLIVILYESQTQFRQIFMDGRALPTNPQPTWLGYSVGRWEGDTLVVETAGFNEKTWLDGSGHPHSDAMRLTERFTRNSVGAMDIQITVDDPRSYTKPLTYTQRQELFPDTELIEYICNENNEANFPHVLGR